MPLSSLIFMFMSQISETNDMWEGTERNKQGNNSIPKLSTLCNISIIKEKQNVLKPSETCIRSISAMAAILSCYTHAKSQE